MTEKKKENHSDSKETVKKKARLFMVQFRSLPRYMKIEILIAIILTINMIASVPFYAWYTGKRQLTDMKVVIAPTGLFISAAHKEDIKYLSLSGIDLRQNDSNGDRVTSKYYVFCVYGIAARAYNLQLAYTTNNPFEYKIYPAIVCEDNDEDKKVDYAVHDTDGNLTGTVYHYKIDGNQIWEENLVTRRVRRSADPEDIDVITQNIRTAFLNKDTASDRTANSTKHTLTYAEYSSSHVQEYAEPVYWQAYGIRSSLPETAGSDDEFCDYFILEVNWQAAYQGAIDSGGDLSNNRETDIIYIIADTASWSG